MAKVILKNVRLAFPTIWTPKPFKAGMEPRFNASFLFAKDHEAFALVSKAIKEVATEAQKDKAANFLEGIKGNSNKMCFIDGNFKDKYDGYAGNFVLSATSKARPTIVDRDRTPLVEQDGRPYAGCYVNAQVDIWCQTKDYPGIRATLTGIQFFRDGDAFSGTSPASADDFEDLSDGSASDGFGTGDDSGFSAV